MKRSCDADLFGAKRRAEVIRLNIGGVHFDTTPQTLSAIPFFAPVIEQRIGYAVDKDDRFFVDRSGELFGIILQFLRTRKRPSQNVLLACGQDLLSECQFYGIDWLASILRGEISPYDMRRADQQLREDEHLTRLDVSENNILVDVFRQHVSYKPRCELELPLLFERTLAKPAARVDFKDFYLHLNKFSGGLLGEVSGIKNIVIAGGAVLGSLINAEAGDVDIYLKAPPSRGEEILRQIYEAVQRNLLKASDDARRSRLLVTRSKNAVTFYSISRGILASPPVQVLQ